MLRALTTWIVARSFEGMAGAFVIILLFYQSEDGPMSTGKFVDYVKLVGWFEIISGYIIFITIATIQLYRNRPKFLTFFIDCIIYYVSSLAVFSLVLYDFSFSFLRQPIFLWGAFVSSVSSAIAYYMAYPGAVKANWPAGEGPASGRG